MKSIPNEPIRLLLIDDEDAFVRVLTKRMAKRHIDVTPAFSGTEALQRMRRADFDVAMLDLKMEGMDGIEVLKILKKMVPQLPVIMLTGHGCHVSAQDAIANGAFDYLSKPYDFEDLLHKIREAHQSGKDAL
ncbi:two-component system response regulator [Desulfosarcina alkanivorans]|uniref:Two-component system response regulator n=1 Tax=Desulfosarcina alkanivorans TaxID=571177 RepID=A0A5K7YVA5_9BACT|nr:response regulator [Desulfosarcina alkanivorans]BBO72250.1 two-component system response regulator [Desulfosarcina alkanivorans]